ncbi:MAG: hypothetical protein ACP5I4_03675 [Oceanipulchritudo sp.]
MFERVQFDEWQTLITMAAFILCFTAFLYFCWRAIRMNRRERDHLSHLPLQTDQNPESPSHERSQKH